MNHPEEQHQPAPSGSCPGSVTDAVRHWIHFDPDLAVSLSKIVHDHCRDVPHDIGVVLALAVAKHQL